MTTPFRCKFGQLHNTVDAPGYECVHCENDRLRAALTEAQHNEARAVDEIAKLKIGHDRYETARMLYPKQWHELWERNLKDHIPFDELIDEITAKAKEPK